MRVNQSLSAKLCNVRISGSIQDLAYVLGHYLFNLMLTKTLDSIKFGEESIALCRTCCLN